MPEWTEVKAIISQIQKRHVSESGKVIQKLLALAMTRLGYGFLEEREVQGVDIDVINRDTGEKHSFEVKTTVKREVQIGAKDLNGLKAREEDDYDTFIAVLCQPLCISEGWIICPASAMKVGSHRAAALVRCRDDALSQRVNSAFPEVVEEIGPHVLDCRPGTALRFLKDKYNI